MPSALPPSSTFETMKISGCPGRLYCSGSMMCSGPKRLVKAMCCWGVMRASRNTRMLWRVHAAMISANVRSSIGRAKSAPITSAQNSPCSGRTTMPAILVLRRDLSFAHGAAPDLQLVLHHDREFLRRRAAHREPGALDLLQDVRAFESERDLARQARDDLPRHTGRAEDSAPRYDREIRQAGFSQGRHVGEKRA